MSTQYEQPIVSIDVVPVAFTGPNGATAPVDRVSANFDGTGVEHRSAKSKVTPRRSPQILRGYRLFEPYKGQAALPGVMLGHETLEAGAYRALASKVGVQREDVTLLLKLGAFDTTDRDPRGPTISIVFIALIRPDFQPDAQLASWFEWAQPQERVLWTPAPFDHETIMDEAFRELGFRLWQDAAVTQGLLGTKFTTGEARSLTHRLRGEASDPANFTRMVRNLPGIKAVGKSSHGVGRPGTVWAFD